MLKSESDNLTREITTTVNKMSYVYRLAARGEIEITFESKRVL